MSSWQTKLLGEFIELKRGYDLPSRNRLPGAFPLVTSSGPTEFISQWKVKGPGVVTGRYGTVGQVFYVREDFWPLNTALYARDFQGNIPRFVYYFLQGIDWEKFNDKSGVPGINRNDVHRESVFVPPLDQQKQIVSVLGALDDKIELNRRMNETLEAMAQAIFRDWFVDFGPVRRKMAGVSDPVAIMGGLTPDPSRAAELAALFPDQLGDDGLPEGWRPATVGSAFNLTMGQSPPGDTYNENGDGLPFFQGRTDFGFRFPEPRKFCTHPTRTARPDDTLISVRAPVGDLNMAWEECCIGRGVAAARHKAGGKTYTYYAMKALQPDLVQFDNEGTVFGAINKKQFEQLVVVEPGDKLTSAFEALAAPLDDRLRSGAAENRTLAETRDYLLPRLMSGEVRVRDLNLENIA